MRSSRCYEYVRRESRRLRLFHHSFRFLFSPQFSRFHFLSADSFCNSNVRLRGPTSIDRANEKKKKLWGFSPQFSLSAKRNRSHFLSFFVLDVVCLLAQNTAQVCDTRRCTCVSSLSVSYRTNRARTHREFMFPLINVMYTIIIWRSQ